MACTWRSSRLAWPPARGISRATATPSSRTSRARGPATPTRGTPSLAPYLAHQPRLQPGVPADWRWPQDFLRGLVRWAWALAWMPEPAEVSWAELALDYEAFVGRALPASPDHRLRGTRLPLGKRAQFLRKAVGLAERHLAAGAMLGGAPLGCYRSLLPLGAFGSPVLRGAPRSHDAADAPRGALP